MKKFIFLLIGLLVSTSVIADDLENVLNKVYDKGSKTAEGYIKNLLDGPGDTEVSISAKNENKRKMANALVQKIAVECGFQFNQPIEKNLNTFFWEKNILKVKGMYVVALIDIIILEVTRNHKQINSFYKD